MLGFSTLPITKINNRAMNGLTNRLPTTHPNTVRFLAEAATPTNAVNKIQENMNNIVLSSLCVYVVIITPFSQSVNQKPYVL